MLNRKNGKTNVLLGGEKILWGIHWSPDSRYVMLAQDHTLAYDVLHGGLLADKTRKMVIYRIEDGATLSGDWFAGPGLGDYGYFWVSDYRVLLKGAASAVDIKSCK